MRANLMTIYGALLFLCFSCSFAQPGQATQSNAVKHFTGSRLLPLDPFWGEKRGRYGAAASLLGNIKPWQTLHPVRLDLKHPLEEYVDRALVQVLMVVDLGEVQGGSEYLERLFDRLRCGAVLMLVPPLESVSPSQRTAIAKIERYLLHPPASSTSDFWPALYFASASDPNIKALMRGWPIYSKGKESTASPSLSTSLWSESEKITIRAKLPKELKQLTAYNIVGVQYRSDKNSAVPKSVVISAAYDAVAGSISLAKGIRRNASGVAALLEVSRLVGDLAKNHNIRPSHDLIFLLSSASMTNHQGASHWMEAYQSAIASGQSPSSKRGKKGAQDRKKNPIVGWISIDGLTGSDTEGIQSGRKNVLSAHTALTPPQAGGGAAGGGGEGLLTSFLANMDAAGQKLARQNSTTKRFDSFRQWEHEVALPHLIPSLTLSALDPASSLDRGTFMDHSVSPQIIEDVNKRANQILQAVCQTFYPAEVAKELMEKERCTSNSTELGRWLEILESHPRFFPGLKKSSSLITQLSEILEKSCDEVTIAPAPISDTSIRFFQDVPLLFESAPTRGTVFDLCYLVGTCFYLFCLYAALAGWDEAVKFIFPDANEKDVSKDQ